MKRCKVTVQNMTGSPYSQSAKHDEPFLDRESHNDYEQRTWLSKCTVDREGNVVIPSMGMKQAIDTAAQKLGLKVPGRRGATYKNYFASGVLSEGNAQLMHKGKPIKPAEAEKVTIQANADGVRGSGKRVPRSFPVFPNWEAEFSFVITDDIITPEVFEDTIKAAGVIVGLGRFRAEKGGVNGRFTVTKIEWEDFRV